MSEPQLPINPHTRPGVGPSVVIMLTGLGLIFLGGCFLLGVLTCNNSHELGFAPPATPYVISSGMFVLQIVCYVMAFACFAGAAFLISVGIKWLRQVMK